MLSQLLNKMDEYLSNKPFKRRWWGRPWIAHMTIQPPLSKDCPLWKRSQDELRLLRLFNLSPEELRLKIERYWKKPRWRRWFSSFGMNKKIDVWNYYQRCLAYQLVRPDKLEQESFVIASKSRLLLNELGLILHQSNVKFERYLEKGCRNPRWIEKHFLNEIKAYKQQLKKTFLTKLNKSLKQIKTGGDRFALKQQAEQEYQQVEAFMLRYYRQRLNDFFSRLSQDNLVPEIGTDVAQEENMANPERNLAVYSHLQTISSSSQSTLPRGDYQTGINSLHGAKEWIQTQRQCLKLLVEEDSLRKVEVLLQTSLNEIKTITELHLEYCKTVLSDIQDKHEAYDAFSKYLDNLQRQLKSLLNDGMLLFHPDHVMNLTSSQAMWGVLNRYSQSYLKQSRHDVDRIESYYVRIEEFYQQSPRELIELARRIKELRQSLNDWNQSVQAFYKKLKKSEAQRAGDKEEMEAKLKESEAKREQTKAEMEAKLKESEAKQAQDKAEMEAKLKESEAKQAQDKAEMGGQINELRNLFFKSKQAASNSSEDTNMPESSPGFFKH